MRLEVKAVTTQAFSNPEKLHPGQCSWVICQHGPLFVGVSFLWSLGPLFLSFFSPSALLKVFVPQSFIF